MEFSLALNLEEEEKKTLAAAVDIIDDLTLEMENIGLENYQDKDSYEWQKIRYAIQDLITQKINPFIRVYFFIQLQTYEV